jgi:molecular chaperone DnaJ
MRGNPPGHLFYHIKVKSHRFWRREQADIHLDVPISLSQALLGDTIKVPTIRGGDLEIAIPPGVQPFETRMLKGKGAPVLGGSDKGNMYLHFITKFPRSLSDNQKKLIAQFAIEDKGNDEAVEEYVQHNPPPTQCMALYFGVNVCHL